MRRRLVFNDGHEVHLIKPKTSIGRRPYNDVVLDAVSISGEHAVLEETAEGVWLEDLRSTNGTFVNGERISKKLLRHLDEIDFADKPLQFLDDRASLGQASGGFADSTQQGTIRVLTGAATGRDVPLTKPVTTLGKAGVSVAAITRRSACFTVAHIDGKPTLMVNGAAVGNEPIPLRNGDLLSLAGTQMMFLQDLQQPSTPGQD